MIRVGFGYDVHRFTSGKNFVLAGVTIPSDFALLGHSDADALSHAIGDALLGSAALGDLGTHFPDNDEKFAGISSLLLLKEIGEMLSKESYKINNIDSTVVLEKPKLAPHIGQMQSNIADCLQLNDSQVSIKATTSEGMGFVGTREGIAVYATVLVEKKAAS